MKQLEQELAFFEKNKQEYLQKYENLFVLIKGERFVGAFPTAETAYEAGLREFDLAPFLVKQVLAEEPVLFVPTVMSAFH